MKRSIVFIVVICCFLGFNLFYIPHGFSAPYLVDDGAKLFEVHCAGCHVNGGNIIRRGKNLKSKALQRNGYDSVESIVNIVTYGKNNMSAYGDRISQQDINKLAKYVLNQAENNWKK